MAKLKALRLAREAAEPPRARRTAKRRQRQEQRSRPKRLRPCPMAGRPAERRTANLRPRLIEDQCVLSNIAKRVLAIEHDRGYAGHRPMDHRSRLGLGVVDLHLKHRKLMLQSHARFFGRFDRFVMRLEVTVDHQRVTGGRRLVGANDLRGCCSSASILGFFILAPCDVPLD